MAVRSPAGVTVECVRGPGRLGQACGRHRRRGSAIRGECLGQAGPTCGTQAPIHPRVYRGGETGRCRSQGARSRAAPQPGAASGENRSSCSARRRGELCQRRSSRCGTARQTVWSNGARMVWPVFDARDRGWLVFAVTRCRWASWSSVGSCASRRVARARRSWCRARAASACRVGKPAAPRRSIRQASTARHRFIHRVLG